jgi:hypothetical protein
MGSLAPGLGWKMGSLAPDFGFKIPPADRENQALDSDFDGSSQSADSPHCSETVAGCNGGSFHPWNSELSDRSETGIWREGGGLANPPVVSLACHLVADCRRSRLFHSPVRLIGIDSRSQDFRFQKEPISPTFWNFESEQVFVISDSNPPRNPRMKQPCADG